MAIDHAAKLETPVIVAGDLHDEKSTLRAQCVDALINTMVYAHLVGVRVVIIPGNHCMHNEKSNSNSLGFLKPYCEIYDEPYLHSLLNVYLIPYQHDPVLLRAILNGIPKGSTVICHQGLQGAWMGDYVQDKTSLRPDDFADLRVISGHYHRAQNIKCGKTGLFSYIGAPFTHSYGEANDGPKGFQVLYSDGSLELIPTNLRKHVIYDMTYEECMNGWPCPGRDDLAWLKIRGTASQLATIQKGHGRYKLDLIPTDSTPAHIDANKLTKDQILDTLIDNSGETEARCQVLKKLWRDVLETS